jgi:disulfide bond formation protein DsbB
MFTSSLSVIGTISLLISFTRIYNQHSSLHLNIVAALAISDLGYALKFLVSSFGALFVSREFVTTGTLQCTALGVAAEFFGFSTNAWNFIISLNLFLVVCR